jgi:hypothetical protein
MPIRDVLGNIGGNYGTAMAQDFARHPLAAFIRGTAATEIESALGENGAGAGRRQRGRGKLGRSPLGSDL